MEINLGWHSPLVKVPINMLSEEQYGKLDSEKCFIGNI